MTQSVRADAPFVLMLTGPSGAGKSTVARAWADAQPSVTAWISTDALRETIRSGRAQPDKDWNEEAERQWWLAADLASGTIRTYLRAGVTCVLDTYAPPMRDDPWDGRLAGLPVVRIDIVPDLESCLRRNAVRDAYRLDEAALRRNHDDYCWSITRFPQPNVIDSSRMTEAETVHAVELAVAASGR
jgi:energy-coupling factor transporter ATP-binding protein EcfA2